MIKISYLALARVLADTKHWYVVENSKAFTERPVLQFVVSNQYPYLGPPNDLCNEADQKKCEENRFKNQGRVILRYDIENAAILACCDKIHDLVQAAKSKAIKASLGEQPTVEPVQQPELVTPDGDPFGRIIRQ